MTASPSSDRRQPSGADTGATSTALPNQVLLAQEGFVAAIVAAAQTRDALAAVRDDAAERRDAAAVLGELLNGTQDPAAVRARRLAAQDRQAAREDRQAAAEDRTALSHGHPLS